MPIILQAETGDKKNPAAGITLFEETSRTRFLSGDEVKRLFECMEKRDHRDVRDFLTLSILTGARKSNIYAMNWKEIDLQNQTWASPGEKQKNGQQKVFALTEREIEILEDRQGLDENWVFPSTGSSSGRVSASGHTETLFKRWRQLRKDAGLEDVRIHDLRKTLASWMVQSGIDLKVVQSAMNHKDLKATAFVYAHSTDAIERAAKEATHTKMLERVLPTSRNTRKRSAQ